MKRITFILALLLLCSISWSSSAQDLMDRLAQLPSVTDVQIMESTSFGEKYLLYFEQPIDHKNPSLGTFTQRVFVCNVHPDSVNVLVTEGYGAQYAARAGYREEISHLFNTNNIVVEHRYFLESAPKDLNWDYLTTENSACDLHNVVTELKKVFKGKWIATGISKGGQTSNLYRTYFPDDVDITVPYVAPLCRGVEDGRHQPFIENYVGTPEERERVKDFQIEFLKRRDAIFPWVDSLCVAEKYEFNIPMEQVYDYCALEFSFAFWQWGSPISSIPANTASDREIFNYMMRLSGPSYLVKWCDISPFFVQAARELGYYGYNTKPFKKWLKVKKTKGYLKTIFLPEGWDCKFHDTLYRKICKFLKTTDSKMLFIYGQYDPWSAVKIDDPHRDNIKIYIHPAGSHAARISSFSEDTRNEIISTLSNWLYD